MTRCQGMNAKSEPCDSPERLVQNGWCRTHGPNEGRAAEIGSLGGLATARKLAGAAFVPDDLAELETLGKV